LTPPCPSGCHTWTRIPSSFLMGGGGEQTMNHEHYYIFIQLKLGRNLENYSFYNDLLI